MPVGAKLVGKSVGTLVVGRSVGAGVWAKLGSGDGTYSGCDSPSIDATAFVPRSASASVAATGTGTVAAWALAWELPMWAAASARILATPWVLRAQR